MVQDSLPEVQTFCFHCDELTKTAIETFVVKTYGDKITLVGNPSGYSAKAPLVVSRALRSLDEVDTLAAELLKVPAKSTGQKVYLLAHGEFNDTQATALSSKLSKAHVQ